MKLKPIAAVYSIVVGLAIIIAWILLLNTGQVPELQTTPIAIIFHITAEFITAILLLIGGIGLMLNHRWAFNIHLVSMGMLIYAIVNATGYYVQNGNMGMIAVFIIAIIPAIIIITCFLLKTGNYGSA